MEIKKTSTKIIAFILAIAVILGTVVTLNAVSSADGQEYTQADVEKYNPEGEDSTGTDDTQNHADNLPSGAPADAPAKEGKTEGKSGKTEGGSGSVVLNPRLRAPINLTGVTGTQKIEANGTYTFIGTKTDALFDVITVAAGLNDVTIVLNGVDIGTNDLVSAPIAIAGGGSRVKVMLNGANKLHAANAPLAPGPANPYIGTSLRAGLEVLAGSKLTIDGTGSLHAQSANDAAEFDPGAGYGGAAGIGAGHGARGSGDIVIRGGNITAVGGHHGSGIGAGWGNGSTDFNILIVGGTVDSTGGRHGNGIGGSCGSPGTGVLVAVPPASVTVRSMTTEHISSSRLAYADLGSMGTFFFMGAEVPEGSTEYNTVSKGGIMKVNPAIIQTETIVSAEYAGGVDLYLDIYSDSAARTAIQPALDLFEGNQAEFFSKLYFGNIPAGKDKVQRISYLTVPGKIITTTPPTGGEPGDELFLSNSIKISGDAAGNPTITNPAPTETDPISGEYNTELAPLLFPQFIFEQGIIAKSSKDLMYGFSEAEAKAQAYKYKYYNELVTNTVTVGGITLSDQTISGKIRKLTLTPDDDKSKANFLYNGTVIATDYEITPELESVANAETTASAWGTLDVYLNPKTAGKPTAVGSYSGSGSVTGRRVSATGEKEIDFSQKVVGGDYIDGGFTKEPGDDKAAVIPSIDERITGHVKVTATPGPGNPIGTPVNLTNNKVTLNYALVDGNLKASDTKVSYIIRPKGSNMPLATDPEWKQFSDGTVVSFPEGIEEEYVIFYHVENPIFNLRSGLDFYDVDLVKPEVASITHTPNPQGEQGIISNLEETINVIFTEDVTGFDPSDIEILVDGKKSDAISIVGGTITQVDGKNYKFNIAADETKLKGNEKIEFVIKEKAVEDRLGNPSISSKDTNTGLKLDFNSGKPIAVISDGIDGSGVTFNDKLTSIDVTITANDTTKNGKIFTDNTASSQVTPRDVAANQDIYKDFIEVVDKDGNPVDYTLTYVDEPGKGGKFVVDFPLGGLDDGDYKIIVNEDKLYNQQGEAVLEKSGDFSVKIPEIDESAGKGAVIDKVEFDQKGGVANITVTGKHLDQAESIIVKEILGGQKTPISDIKIVSKDGDKVVIQVPIPENKDFNNHEYYKFEITLVNPVPTVADQVVKVVLSTDTTTHAEVEVFRAKSILKFNMNGGGPQVKDIVADKAVGNKGGKFDYSNHEVGKAGAPKKAGHMFLGWYDASGKKVKNSVDINTIGGGEYTLTAKWLDLSTAVEGGKGEDIGETTIVAEKPEEDVAKYPGKNTVEEIEKELGGDVIINIPGEPPIHIVPEFEWDNDDMNDPGVKTGKVIVVDPFTGEKIVQKDPVYVYITSRAYISNRGFIAVEQGYHFTQGGSEWGPKVVEEVPDRKTHRIVIKTHPVEFHPNGISADYPGSFTVNFSATITTYKGERFVVPKTSGIALVTPKDEAAAAAIASSLDEDKFWVNAARSLHLLDYRTSWQIDRSNYHHDGSKTGTIKATAAYDRIMTIEANGYPRMSAEVLQMLKEQANTQLVVKYGTGKWEFHSKDFNKNGQKEPTGYFDLGFKVSNENEAINKLLGTRTQQQIKFEMNNNFMGTVLFTIDLSKELRDKTSLNLFNFNEGSKQLELVGKMVNNKDGTASIRLKEVEGTYVILDGLSKSTPKASTSTSSSTEKVLSYRITDITNEFDAKTQKEIEDDLKSVGKNIQSITAKIADDMTLSTIEADDTFVGSEKSPNVAVISVVLAATILTLAAAVYLYIKRKAEDSLN